jgi:type F conjugative transfer system protein TrbI
MNAAGDSPGGGSQLRMRLLLAGAVALAAAAWTWRDRGRAGPALQGQPDAPLPTRLAPEELSQSEANREAPSVAGAYRREVERPKPVQNVAGAAGARDDPPADQPPGGPANRRRDEKKTLPEIFRMPPDPGPAAPALEPAPVAGRGQPGTSASPPVADEFAPFGRLVKCQLVDTLDSVTARSEPIVGIVTQDLDWNGNVIIPADTEVFSYARPDAVIDAAGVGRLVDNGEWTLVLPGGDGLENGRELILKARAVDRRETLVDARGGARSWGIDDGADGLVGYTLSTLDNEEVKLFAAAAIGGMAQGVAAVVERQQPAAGVAGVLGATQVAPTLGNAVAGSAGSGAVEVMNQVASRIREEISKRGVYVRIPAGKEFYLFVEQTIDPREAQVGLRLPGGGRTQK